MNAPELIRLLREQPFRPLELEFSGGHREQVKHPDNIIVTGSRIAVAQFDADDDVPDSIKHYSLQNLVGVETMRQKSA